MSFKISYDCMWGTNKVVYYVYDFYIFQELFERIVKDNLKKLPEGHSFTLLTYGASGSGKTFTLMGTVAAPGLVPRSLEYVFKVVNAAQKPVYKPADNGAEKLGYASQENELQVKFLPLQLCSKFAYYDTV